MSEQKWPERVYMCDTLDNGVFRQVDDPDGWRERFGREVREYIPTESVQSLVKKWRKAAEANQENDPLYTGAIIKSGAEERTYWDGRAAAFNEAADQLISLCNKENNDG